MATSWTEAAGMLAVRSLKNAIRAQWEWIAIAGAAAIIVGSAASLGYFIDHSPADPSMISFYAPVAPRARSLYAKCLASTTERRGALRNMDVKACWIATGSSPTRSSMRTKQTAEIRRLSAAQDPTAPHNRGEQP